ncbi:MAG: ABC transporter permease [Saprospiraceae bacterium]|nr:ABC transporter permease [Saprospiraceae bacterium]
MSKLVPADQVAILLNVQGIDDSNDIWNEEYASLHKKMNLDLPYFYFSIQPNYTILTSNDEYGILEQQLIAKLSKQRYREPFITTLLNLFKECPSSIERKLLSSNTLLQISTKLSTMRNKLDDEIIKRIDTHIQKASLNKIKWHYPVFHLNGLQNQYHLWIKKILRGDFGISLIDTRPVTDKLWDSMQWSLVLVGLNIFFALLIAFPIGLYNGVHPNSTFDNISNGILFAFFAIPKFWLATLFIIFFTTSEFGAWTNIFPSVGRWYTDGSQSFVSMIIEKWENLILPVLMLVIPDTAYLARLIRSSVQEEYSKEYIKTAKSKGLSKKELTINHILPNSLIPTISLLVGSLPSAIASTLVIEVIFNIPGIGRLMFESIESSDWAMLYPIVLIISILAVIIFLIGDFLIAFLNPKIKFK